MSRRRARAAVAALGLASLAGYAAGFPRVTGEAHGFAGYVALFTGLFLLYLAAAWVIRRAPVPDRTLLGLILGFAVLFRLAMVPTEVVLSSDVYRYLWDGRVQRAGLSPYRYPPAAEQLGALRDAAIYPHINRPTKRTVYPPGAEALFALVTAVAPDSLAAWRLFLLGCEAVTVVLLLGLLRRMGVPPAAVLLYAWAPLAVFEGVQAGHLEVALLPLVLLALAWRQAGRMGRAGVALGLAVLLKLYPAVLLLAWWRRGQWRLPLACLGAVAAGYLPHAWAVGPRALGFLPEYFSSAEDFNIGLRFFLTGWIPFESALARETVRGVTMLLLLGVLALALLQIAHRGRDDAAGVFRAAMVAAAAYLVLIPTAMHAWYAVWILPFLAVWPSPAWLWFTGAVSLSYLAYAEEPVGLPLWLRAIEYVPLYALLLWGWWRGRSAASPRRADPAWGPAAAAPAPSELR